ncbi:MAG: hypothetical protein GWO22_41035, partial [Actinobacteria bacterium]|nr:hypothetical protein [Actinomycetota bacterium]
LLAGTPAAAVAATPGPAIDIGVTEPDPDRCSAARLDLCELSTLQEGDTGRAVRQLQGLLYLKRFYRGPIDGVFDRKLAVAVATFHKATSPPRSDATERWTAVAAWKANPPSEIFGIEDWAKLR